MILSFKKYEGTALKEAVSNTYTPKEINITANGNVRLVPISANIIKENIAPYFPGADLKTVVQYARLLERPLLLRGEPGCGKTKLAQAVAYELYNDTEENYRDHYFEWHVKSTTKAIDGLYTYDHLARLRDIQVYQHEKSPTLKQKIDDKKAYRDFGPLGKALLSASKERPAILLIDEIDKADIDFPNDLLLELDQKRFSIKETGESFIAKVAPIIIITSNDEKELPNPFLRRCVFHYIDFPDKALLLNIVRAKAIAILKEFKENEFPKATDVSLKLQQEIVEIFCALQEVAKTNPATDKAPSTSELLDWLKIIHYTKLKDASKLKGDTLPAEDLLHVEVLFKSLDDQKTAKEKYSELKKQYEANLSNNKEG